MMSPVAAAACVGLVALVLYAVLGGADFGGGVWDLLATGPRRRQQREAIATAIGPVWEANHVWLIFAVVLLFTCFPPVFADLATGLYVPLTLALLGIVLRGAAFVFRNYAAGARGVGEPWTVVFGIASLLAPFFFGDAVGAVATGRYAWTSAFALSVGLFAVAVCAQVAAVFILPEIAEPDLLADFRRRAVRSTIAVWAAGVLPVAVAFASEPTVVQRLLHPLALGAIALAVAAGLVVIACVLAARWIAARAAVTFEATAVLAGWFAAQAPELVPGHFTYTSAAASDAMIVAFLVATAAGFVVLVPSLALLLRIFKGKPAGAEEANSQQ